MEAFTGAHVVAVSMGYGHERAAAALASLAKGAETLRADAYPGIPRKDERLWRWTRRVYEAVSRFKRVPVIGDAVFNLMDANQDIPPFYPARDLSRPTIQLRSNYAVIRRFGWCRDLVHRLGKDPQPLICTFSVPAFAAEEFNYPGDIYLVICDSDVSREWVPLKPHKTRIQYIAPTGRVAKRLQLYGIPERNIHLTGFPLPIENVGGVDPLFAKKDLSRRLCVLDPQGIFQGHSAAMLEAQMGDKFCATLHAGSRHVPHLAFAVGGAGTQLEIGVQIVKSLKKEIAEGRIRLTLIAGIRKEVCRAFDEVIREEGLGEAERLGSVALLCSEERADYFTAFNRLMREADILWTKPSELSFYAGLGIPILMAPTVGSQEVANRDWLYHVGAGADALDPRYANEWLSDWIDSGALARMAWNGFVNAPTHGTYRIKDVVSGKPWSMHPLPMIT